MKNAFLLLTVALLFIAFSSLGQETGTFTDSRDGYNYKTVKLGTQTWLAENLVYNADSGCVQKQNGYIYNWQTAMKVAPIGWHLPSKVEWEILIAYLGQNKGIVFEKLKANNCGFNAKFNTYSDPSPVASHDGEYFDWWSSSPAKKTTSWKFVLGFETSVSFRGSSYAFYYGPFRKSERTSGSFVRLIKD